MAMRGRTRLVAIMLVLAMLAVIGVTVSHANPPPPSLPSVSAARLLGSSITALERPFSISGDVRTVLDLGLPQIPSSLGGGAGAGDAITSLVGTQRFKVWRSPDGVRLAHILDFDERTLVVNHTDAWWWDAQDMTAQHLTYSDTSAAQRAHATQAMGDPTAIAGRILRSLAPYARIDVNGTARVAGRPVYRLVLTPRATRTLIGSIDVSIDAATRLPLDVAVVAKGTTAPSMEAGFTSVSFGAIDPSMFVFTPPSGTTVTTPSSQDLPWSGPSMPGQDFAPRSAPHTRVFGTGFATRLAIRLRGPLPSTARMLLPYGGPLASALQVQRGGHTWLLAGFVGLDTLRSDANRLT
jgi:outer membrane lipoprotein-sorting protein